MTYQTHDAFSNLPCRLMIATSAAPRKPMSVPSRLV